MGATASNAIASKGAGKPLEPSTRSKLESGFGADFGHVRVHDDASARSSASALNARAFTHGGDIWLGPGASQSDTRLMAHEATHVVQQAGGVQRMVQRQQKPSTDKKTGDAKGDADPVTLEGKIVKIPKLRMPQYDRKATSVEPGLILPEPKPARPNDQRQVWHKGVKDAASFGGNVIAKMAELKAHKRTSKKNPGKSNYFLRPKGDDKKVIIGDDKTLPEKLTTPTWNASGQYHGYDVDHIKEIQLGGPNSYDNMELLDSSSNRSSGASIAADIEKKTAGAAKQLREKEPNFSKDIVDREGFRKYGYQIMFQSIDASYPNKGEPHWERTQVENAEHVNALRPMTDQEVIQITGEKNRLVLITSRGIRVGDLEGWEQGKTSYPIKNFKPAFDLETVDYDPDKAGGRLTGKLFPRHPPLAIKDVNWDIKEEEGIDYGGSISVSLTDLALGGLSPIEVQAVDLGPKGLEARGVIHPTLPLFKDKNVDIDFYVQGTDIEVSKTFNAGELGFPGPVKVTNSSLTVAVSKKQLSVTGDVDFEIQRLGAGQISGMGAFGGESGAGFGIKGYFELDKKLFEGEARIDAGYQNDAFWAKGHLAVGDGKIRGIKSASIDAEYAKDKFSASGNVKPDIPAVQEAGLQIEYAPETGLKFSGDLALKNDTPGIAGGSIHIEALKPPDSEEFKVKGSGSAKPKIPGIDSELKVTYDDGTFDASVTAAYNKGRLKGSIMVGATNRPVADGQPAGAAVPNAKAITVYGGGTVTVVIAPWLQGTVGVRIIPPNGEVELSGEIALPSTLDVFPEKKLDKNIFTIGLDIPIVGVAVAGQRIGIFANISGGLDVSAGIGPGQLQELSLKITYNPSHEENTQVSGKAKLHVPAHAGLRLFVRGGIGAGIPIVSAEAGLEIGASLGLEGALDTGVEVDWSPAKGLTLDAEASVYVEPKLKVDLSGFVTVDADLFVTTVNLYEKHWQLAAFEYGSNLRFGVSFPVHYQEGQPFDLSLDKVQFQVPQIEPKAMLSDLIARLA
ncbi:eCIS core domain-containing protein [Rhodoblastus sp.]|uniref:eCIS core domain-containing protein n=1 Tax=Rhodoblastus sp. TaxID=1962975 RepID=UPI003F9C3CD9